jgi:hypothetical protein
VDGKEVRATVAQVRRLLGQETALNQKSMAVAEYRKGVEAERNYLKSVLTPLHEAATKRWDTYKDANLFLEAKHMDDETFKCFEEDYRSAKRDFEYLGGELNKFERLSARRAEEEFNERIAKGHATILAEDSAAHIPEWGPSTYEALVNFAVKDLGIPAEEMKGQIDPYYYKLLHLLKQSKAKAAKTTEIKEKAKAAKPATPVTSRVKVTKPGAVVTGGTSKKGDRHNAAMARLRQSGSIKDAADAFLDM